VGSHTMTRPDYGIDAPGMVRNLLIAGTVALTLLLLAPFGFWPSQPWGALLAVCFCSARSLPWFGVSRVLCQPKSQAQPTRASARSYPWSGHEHVLDVGCGHGLMLVAAAKRLPDGSGSRDRPVALEDQADNRPDVP